MIPKRAEDFKIYSRSDDDKRIIILQFSTAQDYIPFAYLKSAEQGQVGQEMTKESYIKTGKDILEKLFTDAYEKKDYREINSLANKCLQHETYLQEARGWLRKIIELPDNEKYIYTYVMVLQMCGEFEKAIEIQKRQLEYTKSEVDKENGLMELAVLYFQAGKNEKGKAIFQNLYYNAQDNIDKLVSLSEICNRNNVNIRQAITWMKRAVELTKDNNYLEESRWMYISPEYLYNLYAELLSKTGQIQESIESATKAVEIARMEDRRRQYQENLERYKSMLK
jgi:tetratricopeptide (TPR) repeat protein